MSSNHALFLIAITLLSGCASYGPWHDAQAVDVTGKHQYPWCAANQALRAQGRTINSPFATTSETRYLACGNGTFELLKEVHAIESHLADSSIASGWKRNIFGKLEVPFDVVLVSVQPNILIVCQQDAQGKSHRYPGAFDSKILERGIGYGPLVLCEQPMSWMDERFQVHPLQAVNPTTKAANFEGGSIELKRVNGAWNTFRK